MKTKPYSKTSASPLRSMQTARFRSLAGRSAGKTTLKPLAENTTEKAAPGTSLPTALGSSSSERDLLQQLLSDRQVADQLTSPILTSENSERMLTTGPTEADLMEMLGTMSVKIPNS
jgi:hypothetical protein